MNATALLMQGRTTFMIAHHLNTLRYCNMILVLEQGRLVEVKELCRRTFPGRGFLGQISRAASCHCSASFMGQVCGSRSSDLP